MWHVGFRYHGDMNINLPMRTGQYRMGHRPHHRARTSAPLADRKPSNRGLSEAASSFYLMKMELGGDQRRLYGDLAWLWPIVSPPREYEEEASFARKTIMEHHRGRPSTLLHLGCGGGHLDTYLRDHFRVTGVDISNDMLDLASRLNPQVSYIQGDMRTVRLGELFDSVMALDSINYMLNERDLGRVFSTAHEHLRPGGVFVTYVEHSKEAFTERIDCSRHSSDDVVVDFIEDCADPDPNDTTIEMTLLFLIRRGTGVELQGDRHLQGLFPLRTWNDLMQEAGFEVREIRAIHEPQTDIPWLVGRRV